MWKMIQYAAQMLAGRHSRRRLALTAFFFLFALTLIPAAQAQTCTTTTSAIAFSSIDVLPGTVIDGTGTIQIACSGFTGTQKLLLCFGIDTGTVATSSSGNRQMANGTNRLIFDIYKDAGRSTLWTNTGTGLASVTISSAAQNVTLTTYARISASQQAVPPGSYANTLSQPVTGKFYTTGTAPVCGAQASFGADPIAVTATVVSSCTVTTNNLNFPSTSFFTANIDATSSVFVICTNSTPYQVRLSGGVAAATDPTLRKMPLGANQITYGLYRDTVRSLPWGATDGTNTQAGTGTSSSVSHTVYGRIPPQASTPPGTYTDTVVVTISFL